jgi:hypothetical protein
MREYLGLIITSLFFIGLFYFQDTDINDTSNSVNCNDNTMNTFER